MAQRAECHTAADFEALRQLESEYDIPPQLRTPIDAYERQALTDIAVSSPGRDAEGNPIPQSEHAAIVSELSSELDAAPAAHEAQIETRLAGAQDRLAARDSSFRDQVATMPVDAATGSRVIETEAIKDGLGLSGAGAAVADERSGQVDSRGMPRVLGEEAGRGELWATLGHKRMGQAAEVLHMGGDDVAVQAADVARDPTGEFARSSEMAVAVAEAREQSGIPALHMAEPTTREEGQLQFRYVTDEDGQVRIQSDRTGTKDDEQGNPVLDANGNPMSVTTRTTDREINSGMGPARGLTEEGGRRQLTTADREAMQQGDLAQHQLMSGEQALTLPAETFAGEEVLGIGGGPTSVWAAEHALAGGAAGAEIAGRMPRPQAGTELATRLDAVEAQIRELVNRNPPAPVPPELTAEQRGIVGEHVVQQQRRQAELEGELANPDALSPVDRESRQRELDQIRGDLDPFLGSRVARNNDFLESGQIPGADGRMVQVQADVIRVVPEGERVRVFYGDGTERVVDRVIPSIGSDPNAPGGINTLLRNLPPEVRLLPVISGDPPRVVGLQSDPPGISIAGGAMTGSTGFNAPEGIRDRIPPEYQAAFIASIREHASRPDVSADSRGIVPGIENVGDNSALMRDQLEPPPDMTPAEVSAMRDADRRAWLARYHQTRGTDLPDDLHEEGDAMSRP
jgi:hypothetical protein